MNHSDHAQNNQTHMNRLFFTGLMLGGLVGTGVMLILAPQSGKKTRVQIQQKSIELRGQTAEAMKDAMAQTGAKARQMSSDLHKQAKELEQHGQALIHEQIKP